MILQTDSRMRDEIDKWGCYYMSLCFLANKYTGIELSAEDLNDRIYNQLIQHGLMKETCWIRDPVGILNYLGLRCDSVGVYEPVTHALKDNEFQILRFKGKDISHFVVGTRSNECAYDPYGVSQAVETGELKAQRVFRRL